MYVSLFNTDNYRSFVDLYYTSFPQDPRLLKTVVYLIYATETVYTVLLAYDFKHFSMLIDDSTPYISVIVIPVGGGIGA